MGDVGYLDEEGKLWFCGRKKHVVIVNNKSYYPTQIESIFNQHPKIAKSALVLNSKNKRPALIIKRKDGKELIESMFLMDLKGIEQTNPITNDIQEFHVENNFPVDVRHNIKIDRTKLQKDVLGA
jgi:acyl-coenzyme A synthetase/AMP-(fatty) acid ligase